MQCRQAGQTCQQLQIVRRSFAETEAGIEQNPLPRDARGHAGVPPLFEKRRDVAKHVLVVRRLLHGVGSALHVHQTHGQTQFAGGLQGAGATQSAHVVEQAGPEGSALAHHLRGTGIQGNNRIDFCGEDFHSGQHAVQFFLNRHRLRAGAGGFAPEVEQRRARIDHTGRRAAQPVEIERITAQVAPAVGERIRGEVEDPHNSGRRKIQRPPGAIQNRRFHDGGRKGLSARLANAGRTRGPAASPRQSPSGINALRRVLR